MARSRLPRPRHLAALLLGTHALAGCATARAAAPVIPLEARIGALLDAPPLHRTSWGVLVTDAATGAVLFERNADRHFIPASNTKLVVSVTALGTLGPEWRYRTEVRASGTAADTVVPELLVLGRGDPTLSARFHGSAGAAAAAIADSVAARGIRVIDALVVDASYFPDEPVHSTWEVGDLPETYAAPVSAFAVEEGTFAVRLFGGLEPGERALASPLDNLHSAVATPQPVVAALRTDTAGARTRTTADYTARHDTVFLSGSIGARAQDTVRLAVTDAADYAGRALGHALARRGVRVNRIQVDRHAVTPTIPERALFTLASPPLADIVAAILQPSQNWIAEQVLKTLGAERGTEGSWRGGLAVERRYLVDVVGLDSLAFNLRDASGLSAQNLLTPAATVRLLGHARTAPWHAQFRSALAAPGLAGSTLENRLTTLSGRLFAKTGTIANVNSLSGYLTTASGRELTFSILSNGSGLPAATVRAAMDSIVQLVAREVR